MYKQHAPQIGSQASNLILLLYWMSDCVFDIAAHAAFFRGFGRRAQGVELGGGCGRLVRVGSGPGTDLRVASVLELRGGPRSLAEQWTQLVKLCDLIEKACFIDMSCRRYPSLISSLGRDHSTYMRVS